MAAAVTSAAPELPGVSTAAGGAGWEELLPDSTAAGGATAPAGGGAAGRAVILLVDDETAVRAAAARVLARRGYTVLEAGDGLEALGVAERHAGAIDLLLSDVRMPGMDGRELARRFRRARPEARVLLMTGYMDPDGGAASEPAGAAMLHKPFTLDALAERI